MGPYRIIQDPMGQYRTLLIIKDHKGPYGTIGDHTGPYRAIWDHTGQYGTIWVQTGEISWSVSDWVSEYVCEFVKIKFIELLTQLKHFGPKTFLDGVRKYLYSHTIRGQKNWGQKIKKKDWVWKNLGFIHTHSSLIHMIFTQLFFTHTFYLIPIIC